MVRVARALCIIALLTSTAAQAHLVVDVKMSIRAPAFVAPGQSFTYEVVADDLANDNAVGLVVTDTLPGGVAFTAVTAPDWSCNFSKGTVTCSAEQLTPGEHVITIRVNAPPQPGTLVNKTHVTSLGSLDPQTSNDDATSTAIVYDPARCTAATPALVAPAEDAVIDSPLVHFTWALVEGGARYVVHATIEGAAAWAVTSTSSTTAIGALDRGSGSWWVEAVFPECPPVASATRHITTTRAPLVAISDVATGFRTPAGLAFGPGGELYVTDEEDSVVRQIKNGQAATIAGSAGERGSVNGQFARFDHPTGITVTPLDGYIFVADTANHEVRILYTGGPFVPAFSVAGSPGTPGYVDGESLITMLNAPSAVAATRRGSIYVADTGNHAIRLMTPVAGFTGVYTVTTAAHFDAPTGLAVDPAGVVYVADSERNTISKIAPGGAVSVFSDASAQLNRPSALAFDTLGNLYVCDRGNRVVRKIAPSGLVTTIAQFADPAGVAVAADGSVYVADAGTHAVRRIEVVTSEPPLPGNRRRAAGH